MKTAKAAKNPRLMGTPEAASNASATAAIETPDPKMAQDSDQDLFRGLCGLRVGKGLSQRGFNYDLSYRTGAGEFFAFAASEGSGLPRPDPLW